MRDPGLFFRTAAAGALTAVETTPAIRVRETPIDGLAINVLVPHENADDTLDIVWFESKDGNSYIEGGRIPQIVSNWSVGSIVPRFYRTRVASRGHYMRLELRPAGTSPDYGAVETWLGPWDPLNNLRFNEVAPALFPPEVSTTGLVAYWPLVEAGGTRADFHGANELAQNGTVGRVRGPGGALPQAADFNGSTANFLSIADNPDLSVGDIPFEITCWVRLTNKAVTRVFVSKDETSDPNREYTLHYNQPVDRLHFQFFFTSSQRADCFANNFGSPPLNTWLFVNAWHDPVANTVSIAVNNGTPDTVAFSLGGANTTAPFRLGQGGNLNPMLGQIAGVTVWKRLLTDAEKDALMNMQLQPEFAPNAALHLM